MAWFDGTYTQDPDELKRAYPRVIADTLRLSEDRNKLLVINDFQEGSLYHKLSDPRAELRDDVAKDYIFYHVVRGEDAKLARKALYSFVKRWDKRNGNGILLARQEKDRLFAYGDGFICTDKLHKQDEMEYELLDSSDWEVPTFILPLKRYFYRCPLCGKRLLPRKGWNDICVECGWEDGGDGPNHCPMEVYRRRYRKLKKENPSYAWWKGMAKCYSQEGAYIGFRT